MRLASINKSLALKLVKTTRPNEMFESIFMECVEQIPLDYFRLLENIELQRMLTDRIFPDGNDFSALKDELDQKYFDAEDQGKIELAGQYFTLARIISALDIYRNSRGISSISDAIYEAIMATPNPDDTARRME